MENELRHHSYELMEIEKTMINNKKLNKPDITGYTLVEILVVMIISFIVFGGVYKALTTENIDLNDEQLMLDAQLNARAALEVVADDIRKASFLGCGGDEKANTVSNAGTNDPIQAHTALGTEDADITITDLPVLDALKGDAGIEYLGDSLAYVNNVGGGHVTYQEGTDVLTVRYLTGDAPLQTAMADGTTSPLDLDRNNFGRGDILYITDCEFYSLFQKTNCSSTTDPAHATTDSCGSEGPPNPSNTSTDLGQAYGRKARVYKLVINTYFIGTGSFTLYRNRTGAGSGIFNNIEDLQFQYKEDTDNDNDLSDQAWSDTFTSAEAVGAIKIYVLAQSDPIYSYTDTNTYDYPNSPYFSAANPFGSANGGGGSPASQAPLPQDGEHRYRYLASVEVGLRNFAH